MALTWEQIVALVDERLQVAIPGLEHSIGDRLNAIIREANTVSLKLHADGASEGVARGQDCAVGCRTGPG